MPRKRKASEGNVGRIHSCTVQGREPRCCETKHSDPCGKTIPKVESNVGGCSKQNLKNPSPEA